MHLLCVGQHLLRLCIGVVVEQFVFDLGAVKPSCNVAVSLWPTTLLETPVGSTADAAATVASSPRHGAMDIGKREGNPCRRCKQDRSRRGDTRGSHRKPPGSSMGGLVAAPYLQSMNASPTGRQVTANISPARARADGSGGQRQQSRFARRCSRCDGYSRRCLDDYRHSMSSPVDLRLEPWEIGIFPGSVHPGRTEFQIGRSGSISDSDVVLVQKTSHPPHVGS